MNNFKVVKDDFELDGKPIQLISGAIHYFRVVPEYWEDRLLKMKACGLNTVETYVSWNLHETKPGQFDFEGILDIERFVKTAGDLGLMVIVRPGPYICAEWEFGGLPSWLLKDPNMRVRCMYRPYIEAVDRFFDELLKRLKPLQCTNGGPIIAMQVENEYGSYGDDKEYLSHIEKGMIDRGINVLLFTSDGPNDMMLTAGSLPHLLKTANFGTKGAANLAKLREFQKEGPLMCMEFWNAWFDAWGDKHHVRDPEEVAETMDEMLSAGNSVNVFMFHGGTNFGFMNGANCDGEKLNPQVTSYDYDAAISESGEIAPKFHAFRKVISKYVDLSDTPIPDSIPVKEFGKIELKETAPLFANLANLTESVKNTTPLTMEELDQNHGFMLYRTELALPPGKRKLVLQEPKDRAQVFLDGEYVGLIFRNESNTLEIDVKRKGAVLDILVENMSRPNYGPFMLERKGITECIRIGYQIIFHWEMFPLSLEDLSNLEYSSAAEVEETPAFFKGIINIDESADTFIEIPHGVKGNCWINGFNLGRYWNIGPQKTLYLPAPLLKKGENELVVFELHSMETPELISRDTPDLG